MAISDMQFLNLRNRLSASEKSDDYNARNFVDVPRQDLKALLDEYPRVLSELLQRRAEVSSIRPELEDSKKEKEQLLSRAKGWETACKASEGREYEAGKKRDALFSELTEAVRALRGLRATIMETRGTDAYQALQAADSVLGKYP